MIKTSAAFAALLDTDPVHLRLTLPDGTQVGDGIRHILGTEHRDAIGFGDAALLITLPPKPVIKSAEWSCGSNAGDDITLGSTVAQQLKAELDREALGGLNLADRMLAAELTIDGAPDVLQVAEVKVTNVDSTDDTVTITASDAMAWAFSEEYALDDAALGFNWEAGVDGETLLRVICGVCGVPLGTTGLPPVTLSLVDASGYTYREVIAFLACLWGRFARIDAQGRLVLQWYRAADRPIGPERYYDGELTKADYSYTVGYLKCYVEPLEETLEAGDTTKTQGIYIKCPWMTLEQLEAVWANIGGFTYRPVSNLRFLGDPRLEPGDVLQVTDRDGAVYTVPCMTLRHEFDGGLVTEITAVGKSESASSLDCMGPVTRAIERAAQEIKTSLIKYQDRIEAKVESIDGRVSTLSVTLDGVTITDEKGQTRIKGSSIETGSISANSIRADQVNLTSSITWGDLSSTIKNSLENTVNAVGSWSYTYGGRTYINGSMLMTGTVIASKLLGGTVGLLDSSERQVGGIDITYTQTGYGLKFWTNKGGIHISSGGNFWVNSRNVEFGILSDGELTVHANLIPSAASPKYSLGSSNSFWTDVYAANGTIQTSDANKKNSIEPLPDKYLDMLDRIEPRRYKMNDGMSGRYHVGFIAQEVEAAMQATEVGSMEFGGLVKALNEEEQETYMLRYDEFVGLLLAKIRRLEQKINRLEGVV